VDNVALVCPTCNEATRVGYRFGPRNGDKIRPLPAPLAAAKTIEEVKLSPMAENDNHTARALRGPLRERCGAECSRSRFSYSSPHAAAAA